MQNPANDAARGEALARAAAGLEEVLATVRGDARAYAAIAAAIAFVEVAAERIGGHHPAGGGTGRPGSAPSDRRAP